MSETSKMSSSPKNEDDLCPFPIDAEMFGRIHATDPPAYWCDGRFHYTPSAFVGVGHVSSPRGWPVRTCLVCGEQLFVEPPS